MKLTPEILANSVQISEDVFRYKNTKYVKLRCKKCGEYCFSIEKTNKDRHEVYCDRNCCLRDSDKNRIGTKRSEESKKKQSKSVTGEKNHFYKKHHSDETKKTISDKQKGKEPWNKGKTGVQVVWNKGKKGVQKVFHTCPYTSKGIPKYDLCAPKLEPYEECKRGKRDPNILRVKCAYCGKLFVPTLNQVTARVAGINSNDGNRFYCTSLCKEECPTAGQRRYPKGQKGFNSREVQPELRQLVFARDKYECQKCGSKESLHCHHIDPVKNNPIESADVDNCITLCKSCHKWCHMNIDGCGYAELANCQEPQTNILKMVVNQ